MSAVPKVETAQEGARRLFGREIAEGFQPVALHCYADAQGVPLFYRPRLKHADGRKVIKPMHVDGLRFALGEPPAPTAGKPLYSLPKLLAADPAALVWIVEGEGCADALHALGMVAVTSGSATSDNAADWQPMQGRHCVLWPDNDKPGTDYATRVGERLQAMGCTVEMIDIDPLQLPVGGDVVDWLADHPDATGADAMALPRTMARAASGTVPLPDPLPAVPAFDETLLPESVRAWCKDTAEGLNVPLEFTAIPAMVALAGAIGRGVAIAMKEHGQWYERPILWGCVIGRPSSGKSPALSPARGMLERLASLDREQHEKAVRNHEVNLMLLDAQRANAKDSIRKALKANDKGKAEALAVATTSDEDAPQEPRIVVNDATVEKLGELLNANPRGLVQFRDEMAGWLASLDREGREGDRAFWLECWNGHGAFTVDRIGRGTIRIEACAVSMFGGMQPGKLTEYVRGAVRGGFSDDGLIQRIQLGVYPDLPAAWRYSDRAPHPAAEETAWLTFQRLRYLVPASIGAETASGCDVPFLRMDSEALALFIQWQTELMQRLRAGEEPAWMESHLAKYPGLVGRLSLVLHLADNGTGPITADTVARALDWCGYLEGHARRIYSPAIDGGIAAAHLLLRKRAELPDGFTAREVYRRGWTGLSTPDAVGEALSVLCDHGFLLEAMADKGGRPSQLYSWVAT